MAKAKPIQNNFTSGEFSPRLNGRSEISKYSNAVAVLENFKVYAHGGISRRQGSRFVAPVKDHNQRIGLYPFVFNDEQAYILEFGDFYMRIYRNGGQFTDPTEQVSNGAFPVGISGWTDLSSGTGSISWSGGGTQRLQLNAGGSGATNQAVAEYSMTVTYIGDLYITSLEVLTAGVRYAIGTASGVIDIFDSGELDVGTHEFQVILPTTNIYLQIYYAPTASGTAEIDLVSLLEPYELATPYPAAVVEELQFAQSADVVWITHRDYKPRKLTRTSPTSWSISAYAPTADPFTSAGNYPRAVCFFQQRLYFGGTANAPSKIWGSASGNYEDLTLGTADDDAFTYTIASGSGRVPVIEWMAGGDLLIIGALGSTFIATGGNSQAITPTNIDVRESSGRGCEPIRPEIIDGAAVYIQRAKRKLRELSYTLESDRYRATNLTILSEHITVGGLTKIAYQQDPDSIIWAVREDGQLIGITYEVEQDVIGFHRHIFGGSGAVENIAVIPNASGDELWLCVKRTINGSEVRYIERLDTEDWREYPSEDDADLLEQMKAAVYLDASLMYDGDPATTIIGADHLIGETVGVLADGLVHPDVVVDSIGRITLNAPASKVTVGLKYQSKMRTLPVAIDLKEGNSTGSNVGWGQLTLIMDKSKGGTVQGNEIFHDEPADMVLFSGRKNDLDLGYDLNGEIEILHNEPLPFTLLAIAGKLDIGD
ncbi:hypothetical protein [Primorskyibacter sedentarius]|uniref:hypothetical protein n=1 Tax=Primorskyibacter sedentarius TaxID=745311 RepID=UPI003EC149C3